MGADSMLRSAAPRVACAAPRCLLQCALADQPLTRLPAPPAMKRSLLAPLALVLVAACAGDDPSTALEGAWTWEGDGGCEGSGERVLVQVGRISWTGAKGEALGSSQVSVQSGFVETDRMQRWVSMDYTRDARQVEDRFAVTDRLGTPVFQLETRRVNDVFEDEFPHRNDRLVPCDG